MCSRLIQHLVVWGVALVMVGCADSHARPVDRVRAFR